MDNFIHYKITYGLNFAQIKEQTKIFKSANQMYN